MVFAIWTNKAYDFCLAWIFSLPSKWNQLGTCDKVTRVTNVVKQLVGMLNTTRILSDPDIAGEMRGDVVGCIVFVRTSAGDWRKLLWWYEARVCKSVKPQSWADPCVFFKEWVSFFLFYFIFWFMMNRSAGQTNRVNRQAVLGRFVCSALQFIPHEPRKRTLIPYIYNASNKDLF